MPGEKRCAYEGCKNTSKKKKLEVSFHRFPKDGDRRSEWILRSCNSKLIDYDDKKLDNLRLCSKHFDDDQIQWKDQGKIKLKPNALPKAHVALSDTEESDIDDNHSNNCNIPVNHCNNTFFNLDLPVLVPGVEPVIIELNNPRLTDSQTPVHDLNKINPNLVLPNENDASQDPSDLLRQEVAKLREEISKKEKIIKLKEKALKVKTAAFHSSQAKSHRKIVKLQKKVKGFSKTVNHLKKKIDKQTEDENLMKKFKKLNENQLNFFKMQADHTKKTKWTDQERRFAISLFYQSPKAYCFLRDRENFSLPCVSKIRRWVNELDLHPGKTCNLIELLKLKTKDMTDKQRECVLMWDELSIKTWLEYNSKKDIIEGFSDMGKYGRTADHANHVLVFMLRGRQHDWRQPICYYTTHNSVKGSLLQKIIVDVLDYCDEAGFTVKSMVCDGGTPNRLAVKDLGITREKPYIERYNRKIFFNFDGPHLMKCLRNNFMINDIKIGKCIASWGAIKELRDRERDSPCKSVPKLTDKHLNPGPFDKMNVSLAVQVMSATTSKGLLSGHYAQDNPLTHEHGVETADFLQHVNDTFDCLNSRSPNDKNPFRRPLSDKNPQVIEHLKDNLEYIDLWQCISRTNPLEEKKNPPCFDGFYLTVNSVLQQWEEMKTQNGVYLLTSRLNQDPLENVFATLRNRSGHNPNPTAMQLRQNLQYTITANLVSTSKSKNCLADETVSLLTIEHQPMETVNNKCTQCKNKSRGDDETNDTNENNDTNELNDFASKNATVIHTDNNVVATDSDSDNDDITLQEAIEISKFFDNEDENIPNVQCTSKFPVNETIVETENCSENVEPIDEDNVNSNLEEENIDISTTNESTSNNQFNRYRSILNVVSGTSTPLRNSIKYVAGYYGNKCIKKFDCATCKETLIRANKNLEQNDDLLIFFRAYKVYGNSDELGNLCVPTNEFTDVIEIAINTFDDVFPKVCFLEKVSEKLKEKIVTNIRDKYDYFWTIDGPCEAHREYLIKFFIRVHIFYKLKWVNWDNRDSKHSQSNAKKRLASLKPTPKLRKLRHE